MGLFSEVVLGLYFRRDTPPEVLAAFARLASDEDASRADIPQPLPAPVAEPDEHWAPDDPPGGEEPWLHDWASWMSSSVGAGICGSGVLQWSERDRWHLSCRAGFKADPETVHLFLKWLAPYVSDGFDGVPTEDRELDECWTSPDTLVGFVKYEDRVRPNLLWLRNGALALDGPTEGDPVVGRLHVVCGLPGSGREELVAERRSSGFYAFDNYFSRTVFDDPHPMSSTYAGAVLRALELGYDVWLADVALCSVEVRQRLTGEFTRRVPDLIVDTVSFANDPEACRANIQVRAAGEPGHDVAFELMHVDTFSPAYQPAGDIRPVAPWQRPE